MNKLKKNLAYSLRWLSIESIIYHAIFLIHQTFLFKFAGAYNYGIIGSIFSIVYFATTIVTFGLESSLSPFFGQIMACKANFKKFFAVQILPTFFLSTLTIPALILLKTYQNFVFLQNISYLFISTIFILILSESIKKVLRGLLYLNFNNKFNMALEIGSLLIYVATIWGIFIVTGKITVNLIFVPMAITSVLSSIILLFFTSIIYSKLPEQTGFAQNIINNIFDKLSDTNNLGNSKSLQYKIFKIRAINFANQFTHNMFSSNFLVPFFAFQFGLAQAGIFKLLSHITYTITMIMRKIFGWASDTMLAHTKNLNINSKQDMFHDINNKINNIMLALIIFLTINLTKIVNYSHTNYSHVNNTQAIINWPLVYFFLAITLIENLFISYEKFYIAEEKNGVILLINAISIFILSGIIIYSHFFTQLWQTGQYLLLFAITATRTICFLLLTVISYYKWHIKPKFIIQPIYLILSIIISLAVFKFL